LGAVIVEKKVYIGNYVSVAEDEINGHVFEKVYIGDGIVIFPFVANGKILLIKEKRLHENPPCRLKVITGFYEYDQSFEENVNRELQEEVGKKANSIIKYITLKNTGTINHTKYFAIACNLEDSKLANPDGEDTITEIIPMAIEEIYNCIMTDKIRIDDISGVLLKLIHDLKNQEIKEMNSVPLF
jgi:ADP-ribose pyrophosphatase YjhB (NUDIX family)